MRMNYVDGSGGYGVEDGNSGENRRGYPLPFKQSHVLHDLRCLGQTEDMAANMFR